MQRWMVVFFSCCAATLIALGGSVPAAPVQASGSISGSVRFAGTPPQPTVLQMAADPFCETAHAGEPVMSERVVVNANGTLRWVFVRIRDVAATVASGGAEPTVLDQVGCVYRPHVIGVRAGATLRIVNSDATLHNVNAQPVNNPPFNFAQPIPGMAIERTFATPEIMIPVRCDVHPWMQAYIGVVAHPFFDVTDEAGSFRLDGVPAGSYVLEAWHETFGTRTIEITVSAGAASAAQFTFGGDR